jgi:hypothetical protein
MCEMPKLKQFFIFDNPYFTGMGNEKLGREYAIQALQMVERDNGFDDDSDWSSKKFTKEMCKPLRYIELWEKAMGRKYGHVASQSPAFHKVVQMLRTKSGLQKVLGTIPGPLHGKGEQDKGIEECFFLVQAMEKCKAGGLGPPTSIPSSSEVPGAPSADSNPQEESVGVDGVDELEAVAKSLDVADTDGSQSQTSAELLGRAQASVANIYSYRHFALMVSPRFDLGPVCA